MPLVPTKKQSTRNHAEAETTAAGETVRKLHGFQAKVPAFGSDLVGEQLRRIADGHQSERILEQGICGLEPAIRDEAAEKPVHQPLRRAGTGKTMAAHAIANALHKEMICVNYADIESKYVGETSKNLTNLFHTASEKDIIIFFDEADALLSKRVTNMSSSTDVSVNQTRSVLLTLLNDYEAW